MVPADTCSHLYRTLSLANETPRGAPAIPFSGSALTGPAHSSRKTCLLFWFEFETPKYLVKQVLGHKQH